MKKIGLYLNSKASDGGSFQYSLAILDAVAALKAKYDILVAYSSTSWANILNEYDIRIINFPLPSYEMNVVLWWRRLGLPTILWRTAALKFHKFTKRFIDAKCDLWIFPSQDIWAYRVPVPALCTIHDLMHRYEKRFAEVSAYGRYRRREAHYHDICKWSVGILVDSEVGKQQVIESYGVHPDKIHVLPYIPPKYIYSTKMPEGFGLQYALPKKFIFYPAQFWSHKNHINLIKAIALLRNKIPDIKLVLVGSKKNAYFKIVEIVNKLKLNDSVLFLEYVSNEELVGLYRLARAMVMPTFFGPTNIPPLEAFGLGCPVAVSNIYGMPEQVGDAALLFDPNSVEEIADSIYMLWVDDELCRELIKRGYKKSKKWNQLEFKKKFEKIVSKILSC